MSESHGFLRGLVSLVGFSQTEVLYARDARHAGPGNDSRYLGSLKIGFNGIFGFSTFPLQLMMWTGFAIATLSVLAIVVVVVLKIWLGSAYPMGIQLLRCSCCSSVGFSSRRSAYSENILGASMTRFAGDHFTSLIEQLMSKCEIRADRGPACTRLDRYRAKSFLPKLRSNRFR